MIFSQHFTMFVVFVKICIDDVIINMEPHVGFSGLTPAVCFKKGSRDERNAAVRCSDSVACVNIRWEIFMEGTVASFLQCHSRLLVHKVLIIK